MVLTHRCFIASCALPYLPVRSEFLIFFILFFSFFATRTGALCEKSGRIFLACKTGLSSVSSGSAVLLWEDLSIIARVIFEPIGSEWRLPS